MIPPASTIQLKSTTPRYSKALPDVPGLFVSAAESAISDLPPTPPPRSKDRKLPSEARKLALEQKKSLPNIKKAAIPPKKSLPDIRKLPDPPALAETTPAEIKRSLVGPRKPVGSSATSSTSKPAPISKSIPAATPTTPVRKAVASPPSAIPTRKAVASSGIVPSAAELAVIAASNPSSPITPKKSLPPKPKPLPEPKVSPDKLAPPTGIARKAVGKMNSASPFTASEPSPAISISSILSPYARGFDSPVESLDASTDRTSFNSSRQPSPLRLTKEASPTKTLPPVPAKDRAPSPFKSPARAELPASELAKTSPPRPEIWKRRPQNSSGSRELPDLNLGRGYGPAVAVPAPSSPQKEISDVPSSTKPARSRPAVTGLPGRNIRPGAAKSAVANPAASRRADKDIYPSQRPPTPEYRKSEGRAPSIDVVKKPASPVSSSPDSPTRSSPDFTTQDVPPKPPKHDFSLQAEQVRRRMAAKAAGAPAPAPLPAIPSQEPARAPTRVPTPTKPPPPAKTLPVPPKPSSPESKLMSTRTSDASSTVMSVVTARTSPSETSSIQDFSASSRSESRAAEQRKPTEALRPDLRDPRIVYSDTQGPMYKGRDGTLYPEMRSLGLPDPRAMYFPKTQLAPIPKSGVITAPTLKISHYNCFQQHKTMGRRSNRTYPLTCQTCCKSDTEDRWACSFCHLRLCETCLNTFNQNDKDLNRLMTVLAGKQF